MEPKEKAQELRGKYNLIFAKQKEWISEKDLIKAVKCAIIAVELRLDGYFMFTSIEYGEDSIQFWEQVKEELEKMLP